LTFRGRATYFKKPVKKRKNRNPLKGFFMKTYLMSAIVLLSSVSLFAQTQTPPKTGSQSPVSMLVMMGVIFAIIYFLMIMPQRKKQKETQNMLNNMKKGDKIVTIGGLLGTVGNVKDTTVMVKIADNTVVEFRKSAIASIINEDKVDKNDVDKIEKKG
jgi:preprotein translocase subunit YajC